MKKILLSVLMLSVLVLGMGAVSAASSKDIILDAADRIISLQNTDGSWDWDVTNDNGPSGTTFLNIAGVTAEVLLDAYEMTGNSDYLNAAEDAGDYIIDGLDALPSNQHFNAFNMVFLQRLSDISSDSTYSDYAENKMDDLMDEVDFWKDSSHVICMEDNSTGCTAEELMNAELTIRDWSTNPSGIVAYDIYNFIKFAKDAGENAFADDMADELEDYMSQSSFDDSIDYYELGLATGILGLEMSGKDYSSYINELVSLQESDGSLVDGAIQDTAYALMAFRVTGEDDAAKEAADFLREEFGYDEYDGWLENNAREYSEITSEAAQALEGYDPEIENVVANPQNPICSNDVTICADVTDLSELAKIALEVESSMDPYVAAHLEGMIHSSGNTYCRTLSTTSFNAEDTRSVEYSIYAEDVYGNYMQTETSSYTYDCMKPTVSFTPTSGVEGESVSFTFTGSDTVSSNGDMTYLWDFGDGETSTDMDPSHIYEDDGTYSVTLTVTDLAGHIGTATKYVSINDVDPTAVIYADSSIIEGSSLEIDASGSYPANADDEITKYEWDFDYDGTTFNVDATGEEATSSAYDEGTYTVALRVTDEDSSVITTMELTVLDHVPTAYAGSDQTIAEGNTINVTGSYDDVPEDQVTSYEWDFSYDGSTFNVDATTLSATSPIYMDDGKYVVAFRVYDEDGYSPISTFILTVTDKAPTADAGSDMTKWEAENFVLDGSLSTSYPDEIVSYKWYNGISLIGEDETLEYHFDQDGVYTIKLVVTDDDGSTDEDEVVVTVKNYLPVFTNLDADVNIVVDHELEYDVDFSDMSPEDSHGFGLVSAPYGAYINPSSGMISWSPTNTGIYTFNVSLNDETDTVYGILTVHVYDYAIPLNAGWNLISIPLVPEEDDLSVDAVFGSLAPHVLKIWSYTYDEASNSNVWEYTEYDNDTEIWSDPDFKIIPGYGYYVLMDDSYDISIACYQNEEESDYQLFLNGDMSYYIGENNSEDTSPVFGMPPSVVLATDSWNLIGVFGLESQNLYHGLESLSSYLVGMPYYDILYDEDGYSPSYLQSKEGYWLSMKLIAGEDSIQYKANYN